MPVGYCALLGLLVDKVAKAFPTAKAVNDALLGLLTLAKTASSGTRSVKSTRKRTA
jgi:hypothetical protein